MNDLLRRPSKPVAWWLASVLVLALVGCTSGADAEPGTDAGTDETTPTEPAQRCTALVDADLGDVTVITAEHTPESPEEPAHCRVTATVQTPGNDVVDSNEVQVHVGMPTQWNGDFFFQGVGGYAGEVGSLSAGLQRGYAAASTDTGHQGVERDGRPATWDGSWAAGNVPKQIDWAYRGTHVATVAAKQVTEAFYGTSPEHAFLEGCSNGGRQGLIEAQRYPDDYDGIVAHAPAVSVVDMFVTWIWQTQALLADPESWLSPEDLATVADASLDAAREADVAVDDLVIDPERLTIDDGVVIDAGILESAQLASLRKIYGGLVHDGRELVMERPLGHEKGWQPFITGIVPPVTADDGMRTFPEGLDAPAAFSLTNEFLRYFVLDDPDVDVARFNLMENIELLEGYRQMLDASDPDLSAFANHGGKLIMTHGWADPALNPRRTIAYYDEVVATLGTAAADVAQLYMVPGRFHCGGGPGLPSFDALSELENWVREGDAPEEIPAVDREGDRAAPLCPYPSGARQARDTAGDLWACG